MRLATAAVELAGVVHRELLVGGIHVAGVDHRVALVLLAEDLPHALAHWSTLRVALRRRRRPFRAARRAPTACPRSARGGTRAAPETPGRGRSRPTSAQPSRARCTPTGRSPRPCGGRDPGCGGRARGCAARRSTGTPGAAARCSST